MKITCGWKHNDNGSKTPIEWVYNDDGFCLSLQIAGEEFAMIEPDEICAIADAIHGLNRRSAEIRAAESIREVR